MSLVLRLLVAASIIAGFHVGQAALRRHVEPHSVCLDVDTLNAIPLEFGIWKGRAVALDPDLVTATGADATLHRMYDNPRGLPVAVDLALYTRYDLQVPHEPPLCYESNGWTILQSYPFAIGDDPHQRDPARLMVCQREPGRRIMVLYWYQLGQSILLDRSSMRRAQWQLRGREKWPPLVKVMLQTPYDPSFQGPGRLKCFAELLLPHLDVLDPAARPLAAASANPSVGNPKR